MKIIICHSCNYERKENDFLLSEICYKCVLREKLDKLRSNLKKPRVCAICTHHVPKNRWVYCSQECADVAELKRQKNYWIWNV